MVWSHELITPFVCAFFLAYAINPLVDFIEGKGAKRSYAILTVYMVVLIITALVVGMIIPRVMQDLSRVREKMPSLLKLFEIGALRLEKLKFNHGLPFDLSFITNELAARGEVMARRFLIQLAEGILAIFSQSFLLVFIPLLSYYISRDYPQMKLRAFRWLLRHFGAHWTNTFLKIDSVFRLYIRGQLFVTVIVGVLISIGLSIMGFEAAFFLGLLAGIFNLIPYFGPVLGALPPIFLGVLKSPWYILYVPLLFLAVNQVEVLLLTPRLIGGSLGMHPVTVLYLVLIGGKIFGIVGMVFAVPLGALVIIIIRSIYEICFGLVNCRVGAKKPDFNPEKVD